MEKKDYTLDYKIFRFLFLALFSFVSVIGSGQPSQNLEKTEILGKEYYVYEVKQGESIYGIVKRLGWDMEELLRLNPDASKSINKGDKLYYPTGQVSVVKESNIDKTVELKNLETIHHKVKRGETIYSISRQYNTPLEIIYQKNPSTKRGVKAGEIIEIPQSPDSQYYYYTIKKGDTLTSISQQFNTSVEDLLKDNAGLTANNIKEGEVIRVSVNSNSTKIKTELVAEERVSKISNYKVSKNETWSDISEKTGVEEEVLKETNKTSEEPKEKSVVSIPVVETVEVEKTTFYEDERELTPEGVNEIYESVKGVEKSGESLDEVNIALILDDPKAKKDIDFTRGMIIGLSELKNEPYKINFKVIDGRSSTNNVTDELDYFEPDIIITTADHAFPAFLADYGNTNNIQILNAFDLKNDLYEDNASMVQLLPPSGYFNDRISTWIYNEFPSNNLIIIGEEDQENDGILSELIKLYDGESKTLSLEEFYKYPTEEETVLIYSTATKKEEIDDFLKVLDDKKEEGYNQKINLIGRSNWIAFIDDFNDKFEEYGVLLPTRVWLDEKSGNWKHFITTYETMFEGNPVRSIPNFAASGYDIAKIFIPEVAETGGDFNKSVNLEKRRGLQSNYSISRVNNWGGFINNQGYIIKFNPNKRNDRIIVK